MIPTLMHRLRQETTMIPDGTAGKFNLWAPAWIAECPAMGSLGYWNCRG
jgi:hypothetical protein